MVPRMLPWQGRPWRWQFERHDVFFFLRILKKSFHFGKGD